MTNVSINPVRTNFNIVTIDNLELFFSYTTLVAIRKFTGNTCISYRTDVNYSNTIERHMKEANCKHWDKIPQETLEQLVNDK